MLQNGNNYLGNPNLKRVLNVSVEWTEEQIDEYTRCMDNPLYFIENYIKNCFFDEGLVPFKLYDFQKEMVGTFHKTVLQSANFQDSRVNQQQLLHIFCTMSYSMAMLMLQYLQTKQRPPETS